MQNIGGITDTDIEFRPGITVLSGQNATNRTSLLTAMIGALGGEKATLKSDADAGEVGLEIGERSYTRTYTRQGGTVTTAGSPLSDDSDIVDLFVGLIEGNDARRAVERGDDLREVIMRPVDTDAIRARLRELEREREGIERELDEVDRRLSRLPELEERRRELEAERDELTADLDAVRETIEECDAAEAEEVETLLDEIDDRREERDRLEQDIETQRSSVEALRGERREIERELDDTTVDEGTLEELDGEIDRLRRRKRELEDLISDLSAIVDVNDDLVNTDGAALPGVESEAASPTSALDPMAQEVECWTCGSQVRKRAIADRLEEVRQVIDEQRRRRNEVVEELEEAEERRAEIRDTADERDDLQRRLRQIDRQIDRREERIESLREDRTRIQEEIEELETQLEESEELEDSELAAHYQRLSDLEYERGQLDQQLSAVDTEIEEIERLSDDEGQLEAQRAELTDEIESLRSRIGDLERSAVEQFNDRMADLLDMLGYENLERVWIERRTEAGGRGGTSTTFDLHVVRESAEGAVYEDTVEHLSESEREVIGLVVALAGYLVHDAHEEVPFALLDSLEAIDAGRIDGLLRYFADYVPYLVVALLPEDARALAVEHDRISADALGG